MPSTNDVAHIAKVAQYSKSLGKSKAANYFRVELMIPSLAWELALKCPQDHQDVIYYYDEQKQRYSHVCQAKCVAGNPKGSIVFIATPLQCSFR
jgi:hypothetical protein